MIHLVKDVSIISIDGDKVISVRTSSILRVEVKLPSSALKVKEKPPSPTTSSDELGAFLVAP